jgi:predicted dinucleotide-utilizing enzyme
MKRVGLVGYGYIGKAIYQRILENSENIEPAFVYTRDVIQI